MPEIEVLPSGLPPLSQLVDDIAQMRPAFFTDPFRRSYLFPVVVVKDMFVMRISVPFP